MSPSVVAKEGLRLISLRSNSSSNTVITGASVFDTIPSSLKVYMFSIPVTYSPF